MRNCAWLVGLAFLILTGCSTARLVSSDTKGGCVAVADNTDRWPTYNMTKAREMMEKECPGGYTIVRQEEFITGQTTTNNTERDTKETPIVKGLVNGVHETTRNSTTVRDQTEWRIWYQRK